MNKKVERFADALKERMKIHLEMMHNLALLMAWVNLIHGQSLVRV